MMMSGVTRLEMIKMKTIKTVFYICLLTELGAASVNGPDSIDVA